MSEVTDSSQLTQYTGNMLKGLELLGNGLSPAVVAATLGVTDGAVSQWLAQQDFAEQVTARRFNNMQKHAGRDQKWDNIEDQLLDRMQDLIHQMWKPNEVFRALALANAAKRRGPSAPENVHIANTVVNLTIPVQISQRFLKNNDNQVIEVEAAPVVQGALPQKQALITISSDSLMNLRQQNGATNDTSIPALPGSGTKGEGTG